MKKKQERLDKIMLASCQRMQDEVSALLGKTMTFAEPQTQLLSKEEYFSEPAGKSVLAHVKLDGDLAGDGCLIVPIRDAIRIGGTLIMLPDSELESVIAEEEYTEELEDSYGEIANIICGSLTSIFEEQYPKTFRVVRTEQEVILPVKVDPESAEPVPQGTYYLMTSDMHLEEQELGKLQLLLPASSFGLVKETEPEAPKDALPEEEGEKAPPSSGSETPQDTQAEKIERTEAEAAEEVKVMARPEGEAGKDTNPQPSRPPKDIKKQKERIDQLLTSCLGSIGEEVGALLGGTFALQPEESGIFTKAEFLEQAGGRQILARMEIRGDGSGEAYLFVSLKDAVFLGGTLIMLPDAELDEVVRNEEFGEDVEDAYGEIANIISGVYTRIFEEQYRKNFGFVKTALETVVPVKIDPESDECFPQDLYYLSAGELSFNGKELGRIQVAFPAALFELESLVAPEEEAVAPSPGAGKARGSSGESPESQVVQERGAGQSMGSPQGGGIASSTGDPADILLFTDDDTEAGCIADLLAQSGYVPRILHYRDPVGNFLTPGIHLVFLVMGEVNEQGFGMAIKLSGSGLQVPLVVAGPAWTRTTVLKAVKYGASDILLTPATAEDVREKLEAHLVKKAA